MFAYSTNREGFKNKRNNFTTKHLTVFPPNKADNVKTYLWGNTAEHTPKCGQRPRVKHS